MSERQIARAAGVLLVISILARLAGFVREQALAAVFGTSAATDAYLMAFTLPNLFFVVVGGALATAFLPVITQRKVSGNAGDDKRLAASVLNLTLVGMLILALIGVIFTPSFIALLAYGFAPDQMALTVRLARILFPCAVLLAISGLLGALLNSYKKFAVPAFTSIAFSLTLIAGIFLLTPTMGVVGLAWATVLATVAQVSVQLPSLYRSGYRHSLTAFDWRDEGVRKVGKLMLPAMLGTSVAQIYVTVDRILASGLPTGSIAALNFANKLMFLPFNLFVMTVSTAVYPYLSEHAARKEYKELGEATVFGLVLISIFTIPASVGLFVLAEPLVEVLFQRGAFNDHSTEMTAFALRFLALGLFAQGAYNIVNRTFFAMQDTMTPVKVSVVVVVLNICFNLLLIGPLQHGGLALANSLASICNLVFIYYLLRRRLPQMPGKRLALDFAKLTLASALMGGAVYFLQFEYLPGLIVMDDFAGQAQVLGLSIFAGGAVYLFLILALRIHEVELLRHKVHRRLFKSPPGQSRIFISGYYGFGNTGDEAVLAVLVRHLSQLTQVKRISVLAAKAGSTLEGVQVVGRRSPLRVLKAILRSDVLISGGGGLLQNATSNRSLWYYLAIISVAKLSGCRVLIVANGIGPLRGDFSRWMVGRAVAGCDYISVRDDVSREDLIAMKVAPDQIRQVADPAFLLQRADVVPLTPDTLIGESGGAYIAIALRFWKRLPLTGKLIALVSHIQRQTGYTVCLVPMQEPADRELAEIIRAAVPGVVVTAPQLGPRQIAAVFASSEMTVAMRLHGLIFAVAAGVPVLALAYDPKVAALAEQTAQPCVADLKGATEEELMAAFDQAFQNRADSAQALHLRMPDLMAASQQGMEEMQRAVVSGGQ